MQQYIYNHPVITAILVLLFASITTGVFIPSITKIARAKNLVSPPNSRTSHKGSIPALGGIAIFAALGISILLFVNSSNCDHCRFFIAGLFVIFFVGLKDDIFPLTPYKKLLGQIIAAGILVVLGDVHITNLHGILGIGELPVSISIPLSIFLVLAVINSINLIDGIDGLAAGIGVIASLTFGIWFLLVNEIQMALISLAVVGSFTTFFFYNTSKGQYKIFLGDTGSLILGLTLAYLSIQFSEMNLEAGRYSIQAAPVIIAGILIVPFFDTLRVFIVRISIGKSPFSADKLHVHHRLLFLYMSHLKATATILLFNVLMIAFVFFIQSIAAIWLLLIVGAIATIASYIPVYIIGQKNYNNLSMAAQKEYQKVKPQYRRAHQQELKHKHRTAKKVLSDKVHTS